MNGHVLVVDDEPAMQELVQAALGEVGLEVLTASSGEEALRVARETPLDAVLTDVRMKGMSGIALCSSVKEHFPSVPVVVMTGFGSMETAVEALRAGAYDFVTKPLDLDTLERVVCRAVEHGQLTAEVQRLRRAAPRPADFPEILGSSGPMRTLLNLLPRAARSRAPVLLRGETGTGKELIASALHRSGDQASQPFVPVNCAAIAAQLLESELFGHRKGAFTDAKADRGGLFLEAGSGTLFLDEIGELPLDLQPKLLRVLQERRVRPVGGDREVPIHCRVVCATHRDLQSDVSAGRFREDLYYRINVIAIEVPPLRERVEDILVLAQHFLELASARDGVAVSGFDSGFARALLIHPWPGNVRELQNCMERAVALAERQILGPEDLPPSLGGLGMVGGQDGPIGHLVPLAEIERRHILGVIDRIGGNRSRAAQILGVDRKTLYRRLEQYAQDEGG